MLIPRIIRRASKLLSLQHPATLVVYRKYAAKPIRCDPHMNELPIPCGPWEPWYNDRQAFYNKVLIGGALWWLLSLVLMVWTGSFYLNWGPPAQPGPPSDMVEDCEDEDSL